MVDGAVETTTGGSVIAQPRLVHLVQLVRPEHQNTFSISKTKVHLVHLV